MLADEERKYILNEFLRNISHISDKEYQQRVWIKGQGPECDDFDEACCDFFGDGDPIIENYKDFKITENQYRRLVNFRKDFDDFPFRFNLPQEFIDTPEWAEIMNTAKDVLKAFNYQK